MLAPILPRPTMAILICSLLSVRRCLVSVRRCLDWPPRSSNDLAQVFDPYSKHAAAVGQQALVVADRLRRDEGAEVVGLVGDGQLGLRARSHQLHGHDGVGTALVELAGRMQE